MIDVGDTLGRKIGPLPVWAWGGVVGGGILIVRALGGNDGASSPFVQPIATPDAMDFEGGGAGGGSDAPQPWYAQLPGVGTIIDRPPGEVTIIPPAPSPSSPATPSTPAGRTILTLRKRTFLFRNPLRPHTSEGTSGSYIVSKVKVGGKWWYRITGTTSGAQSSRIGQYIPFYSNPTTYAIRQGDTSYVEGGDSTPVTPTALVPAMPPQPLPGVRFDTDMGFPGGEPVVLYRGPSIDDFTPIASAARIAMPPLTGRTGSVNIPTVPYPSARAGRFDPARFGDGFARVIDGWRPKVPPTTVRLPVNPLARWQERLTARRSTTG